MNDGLIDGRNLRVRYGEEINKDEGILRLRKILIFQEAMSECSTPLAL